MKSRTFRTLGLATLLVSSGWAQLSSPVKANVPFDFSAGTTKLAAGEYSVQRISQSAVKLVDGNGRNAVILMTDLASGKAAAGPALIFHRYGGSYFLSQIWGDGQAGVQLHKTPAERELARTNGTESTRVVASIR